MARYFFNIHDGLDLPDAEGIKLPSFESMRHEAIRAAGEMLKDTAGKFDGEEWTMNVTDEAGKPVLTLRFSETQHL